jgi:hypothetical protein
VSEVLHTGEITKQMGSQIKHKFYDMWFTNFHDHSLSFTHWYEIYQHERSQEPEFAKNIHQYEQEEEDWDDIPMASQQPLVTPTHRLARVFRF